MKKRSVRILTTTALISAMVLSMGMSAMAAEFPTSIPFTKTVTADGDTYAPNTSFEFVLAPVSYEGGSIVMDTGNGSVIVYNGVEGGIALNESNITFQASEGIISADTGLTKNGTIHIDTAKFIRPGVYAYDLSETAGTYKGITYDTTKYRIFVTIINKPDGDGYVCSSIKGAAIEGEGDSETLGDKLDSLPFTNDYGKTNDTTHDITITKKLDGNQVEKTRKFEFHIKVTGDQAGELYKVVKTSAGSGATEELTALSGDAADYVTVELGDEESIKIYGLTDGDIVDVHEDGKYADAAEGGYTISKTNSDGSFMNVTDDVNTGVIATVIKDGAEVTVTNFRGTNVATGVALSFGPYALMVALAGVFAALFLRRKKETDEF